MSSFCIEKRKANSMIYVDLKGFVRLTEALFSDNSDTAICNFIKSWTEFRDSLIQIKDKKYNHVYLANRIGDAFVIFSFAKDADLILDFILNYLQKEFDAFRTKLQLPPNFNEEYGGLHLKIAVFGGDCTYFQTADVPDKIMGKKTLARVDFFSRAINILARIDALPEADQHIFLCDEKFYNKINSSFFEQYANLVELGEFQLRGIKDSIRIYGLKK